MRFRDTADEAVARSVDYLDYVARLFAQHADTMLRVAFRQG